ncbi:MAG: adenylosuccinate synthase [Planctomycetota bacterium]|nr:MAG: adenylosuccinate synthase [Planctomycetota bacterium]
MSVTSVVGLQWGDEAKGKIVDFLTDSHEVVVRYQGGNNAGHTVKFDGQTYKLSLLPTGILRPGVKAVIGNGLVVNPEALLKEMKSLTDRGVQVDGQNLLLSDRAHVILPYHIVEDAVFEKRRGNQAIGTTGRGIGTCYRDKAGRTHAIRVGDLYHPETFRTKLADIVAFKNLTLKALDSTLEPLNADAIYESYMGYAEQLKSHVVDTTAWLHRALKEKKNILFEGAQGSLLDVDHGTFPYVTSSNSSSAGIHSGSGVPQRAITRMIGIAKAYTTRVGGGPFPTELNNEIGQHIRDVGHEYGTVTGRPRRCGWFDAVATGYGARICGVDEIAVMLLDVLAQLDELCICEAYEIRGERTTDFPSHVEDLEVAKPVFRKIPGWKKDITHARKLSDLPSGARQYVDTISELLGVPAKFISIGPDREQTILL